MRLKHIIITLILYRLYKTISIGISSGNKIQDKLKYLKIYVYRGERWLKIIKINLVSFQNLTVFQTKKCKIELFILHFFVWNIIFYCINIVLLLIDKHFISKNNREKNKLRNGGNISFTIIFVLYIEKIQMWIFIMNDII